MKPTQVFREPQHAFAHVEVPVDGGRPWPHSRATLTTQIVGAGRRMRLAEFLTLTSGTSLVVVIDGVLVHEEYAEGYGADDRLLGNSATKSVLALLTGLAVTAGQLPDLDAHVGDYVPELSKSGYAGVSVRQLLTMTSGVDWNEDYRAPGGPASRMLEVARDGRGGLRELVATIPPGDPPGSRYAYCSADSLVLDWVRERASGRAFAEALGDLWRIIGAEQPAVVGLDAPRTDGGVAMAAHALAATPRDWARLGVLQVGGTWNGDQVLSPEWVAASSRPGRDFLCPGRLPSSLTAHAGFGYHWWPLDEPGTRVMADGMRGQFVYVDRRRHIVVVKTSAWPYDDPWWDRQCRDLCYLALPAIADSAAALG